VGYPKRLTKGRVECRPKIFQSEIFPQSSFACNQECIYYIFCKMELEKKTLGDRLKNLRLSFQMPYYFFSMVSNGEIMLILENDEGKRRSFRGKTIVKSVEKAENFLERTKERKEKIPKKEEKKDKIEKEENKEKITKEKITKEKKENIKKRK